MRSSGFSCTGTLICFTVDRRVAKLWKPEERQRSPRMMPLAAAVPSPRRKLFPGLGYPSAVALERVAVYLDADAGVLRDPHLAVRHADCAAYKVLAEGVRGGVVLEHRLLRVHRQRRRGRLWESR